LLNINKFCTQDGCVFAVQHKTLLPGVCYQEVCDRPKLAGSETPAFTQPVDGVKQRVHQLGLVFRILKELGVFSQQR